MKKFLNDKRGEVNQKIIFFAIIVIIILIFFPGLKVKAQCATQISDSGIFATIFENSPQYQACIAQGTPDATSNPSGATSNVELANASNTNGVLNGGGTGGSTGTISVDAGSISGNSSSSTVGTIPTGQYTPVTYFDSGGVSLQCTDTLSYYQFSIPSNATYGSTGTQTITITNQKGWDMWTEITGVQGANGLRIVSFTPTNYQFLANNTSASYKVSWAWDGSNPSGGPASATVYFKSVCTKPADTDIYQPIPTAPSTFTVTGKTDTSISLNWSSSAYAFGYRVYRGSQLVYNGANLSFIDTNLTSGTTYSYKVYAYNNIGTSSDNSSVSDTTTGTSPLPVSPNNFTISNVTDTSITLSWSSVANATSYKISGPTTVTTSGTSYTYTNLTPGTSYDFYLYSQNSYGDSNNYKYASTTTTGTSPLPSPENNFRVTGVTDTTISLAWDAIPNATGYHLWNYVNANLPSTQLTYTATGFTPGTRYYICMAGTNSYGQGNANCVTAYTSGTNPYPSSPSNFKITNTTNTTMTVAWNFVSNATSYTLTMDGKTVYTGTNTSYTASGLFQNSYHYFNVYALNSAGSSSSSYTSGYTTNQTYDGSSSINNQCSPNTITKSFTMPSGIQPGSTGGFVTTVTNNSSTGINVKIDSITKSGDLFAGSSPITFTYDSNSMPVSSNSSVEIPVKWDYPIDGDPSYAGKAGSITVNLSTTCQ